jgi:hypothetical protein
MTRQSLGREPGSGVDGFAGFCASLAPVSKSVGAVKALRHFLLAFLLLGGQSALIAHATDFKAHAHSDSVCEVCLHSSAVEGGLLGEPVTLPVIVTPVRVSPLPFTAPAGVVLFSFDARGPPTLSA